MGISKAKSTSLPHNQRHGKIIQVATTAIGLIKLPKTMPMKPAKSAMVVRMIRGGPIKSATGETTWVNAVAKGDTKTQTIAEIKKSSRVAFKKSARILRHKGLDSCVKSSSGLSSGCENFGITQIRQAVARNERVQPGLNKSHGWTNARMIQEAVRV